MKKFPPNWNCEGLHRDKIYAVAKQIASDTWGWRLSFSEVEKDHISQIDRDGKQRKLCLRIVKLRTMDANGGRPGGLTSYQLKNAWLSYVANLPAAGNWVDDRDVQKQRVLGLIDHTIHMVQKNKIPLFFAPTINLWKGKENVELIVKCLEKVKKEVETLQ